RSSDGGQRPPKRKGGRRQDEVDEGMQRFLVDVGHQHGLKPGNLVGAIANEAGLDNSHIGKIDISEDHATVDLPAQMPPALLNHLKKVWVCG
ncbi:MAG: DbpA RNA binding domain-containing protein, partial [Thioalkalivibrio sp.]